MENEELQTQLLHIAGMLKSHCMGFVLPLTARLNDLQVAAESGLDDRVDMLASEIIIRATAAGLFHDIFMRSFDALCLELVDAIGDDEPQLDCFANCYSEFYKSTNKSEHLISELISLEVVRHA